jgi:hypothetical protein
MTDDHAAVIAQTLDAAVLAMAMIDEDREAGVAVTKYAERDDLLHIIGNLVSLITDHLGDDGARDYFEAVRKSAAAYEATGKAPMPRMRDYLEDDGVDDGLAADAAELIDMAVRGHDTDDRIERLLKYDSAAGLIAELAQIAAALAMRISQGDWHAATRITASAARLP